MFDRARDKAEDLLESTGDRSKDLIGVGIGLPGPVERSAGRPVRLPTLPGWDGFDVAGYVSRAFPVPVLVDNDINLMALGEQRTFWPDTKNLLFIRVASGVGMGIISSGALQRGADGSAGDLGHVAVGRGSDMLCDCGNYGCLEALAGAPAVARSLTGSAEADVANLIVLGQRGDVRASTALRQAGRDIGSVLAGCVNMLNPSVVVVSGPIVEAGDSVLAGIREVVYKRSLPLATARLTIAKSQAMHDVGVIGAASMVAEHVLSPLAIENMLAAARLDDGAPVAVSA
ncbi:ROK family protein [Streptomyces sp. L7]|uniref:ROK family protein n=1 Tax=Streptomyces sp. L7 TaxID=3423954 RepID=UPI003D99C26D